MPGAVMMRLASAIDIAGQGLDGDSGSLMDASLLRARAVRAPRSSVAGEQA
jgi:hypothetical protein